MNTETESMNWAFIANEVRTTGEAYVCSWLEEERFVRLRKEARLFGLKLFRWDGEIWAEAIVK